MADVAGLRTGESIGTVSTVVGSKRAGSRVNAFVRTAVGPHDTAVSGKPARVIDRVDPVRAPGQHIPAGVISAIVFIRRLRQRTGAKHEDRRKNKLDLSQHL